LLVINVLAIYLYKCRGVPQKGKTTQEGKVEKYGTMHVINTIKYIYYI